MLEYIVELLSKGWGRLSPWFIVPQYDGAIVLRLGKWHRDAATGWNWKVPLIDEVLSATKVMTTLTLRPQTLTTSDDVSVVISSIIKYEIKNVRPYILNIIDRTDVLSDVALGAIRRAVREATYSAMLSGDIEQSLLQTVRAEVNKYGFKVHAITFADCGKIRSYRFIADNFKDAIQPLEA